MPVAHLSHIDINACRIFAVAALRSKLSEETDTMRQSNQKKPDTTSPWGDRSGLQAALTKVRKKSFQLCRLSYDLHTKVMSATSVTKRLPPVTLF